MFNSNNISTLTFVFFKKKMLTKVNSCARSV